jgi:hypothetical protein
MGCLHFVLDLENWGLFSHSFISGSPTPMDKLQTALSLAKASALQLGPPNKRDGGKIVTLTIILSGGGQIHAEALFISPSSAEDVVRLRVPFLSPTRHTNSEQPLSHQSEDIVGQYSASR